MSYHTETPFDANYTADTRLIGVMFAGQDEDGCEDIVYVAANTHWEGHALTLPQLPGTLCWQAAVYTGDGDCAPAGGQIALGPRSVAVLYAAKAK